MGYEIVHTGEVVGISGSSCNLASINLKKFIVCNDNEYSIDFDDLRAVVAVMVKFLDDIVSISNTGIERFDTIKRLERKIGIGVMGFSDVLSYLKIPYDSQEAVELSEVLSKVIFATAQHTSRILSKELKPYLAYNGHCIDPVTLQAQEPQRNSALVSVAPTGTISLVANVNWSIEPYYMLAYRKNFSFGEKAREGKIVISETFEDILHRELSDEEFEKVLENVLIDGVLLSHEEYSEELNARIIELANYFKVAYQVAPENHLKIQAAWQRNIDLSISKTVNLSNSATVEDIEELIYLAWKLKLKGFTVFRDGCREEQVIEKI